METSSINPSFLYSCLRTQRVSENWQSAAELDKGFAVKSVDRGNRQNNIPNRGDEPRLPSGADPKCQKRSQPEGRRREDRTQEGFCFDTSAPDCHHRDAALSRWPSEQRARRDLQRTHLESAIGLAGLGDKRRTVEHVDYPYSGYRVVREVLRPRLDFDRGELPVLFLPGQSARKRRQSVPFRRN